MDLYTSESLADFFLEGGINEPVIGKIFVDYLDIIRKYLKLPLEYNLEKQEDVDLLIEEINSVLELRVICAISVFIVGVRTVNLEFLKNYVISSPFFLKNIITPLSEGIELTPQFYKAKLYPSQSKLLYRMLELEDNSCCHLGDIVVNTNTAIVSERTGFGKSFSIPALICKQKIPNFKRIETDARAGTSHVKSKENLICTNLVFCTPKTVKQWYLNCTTNTSLTTLKVETPNELKNIIIKVESGNFPEILICKVGKINGKDTIDEIGSIFKNFIFSRIIFDDFDTLNINTNSLVPSSLFNWLISSTKNLEKFKMGDENEDRASFHRLFRQFRIFKYLYDVRCEKDYGNLDFNVPQIDYYFSDLSNIENVENKIYVESVNDIIKFSENSKKFEEYELEKLNIIKGSYDAPFDPKISAKKVLVYAPNKNDRDKISREFNSRGIQTMNLKRNNLEIYKMSKTVFAITPFISGINMEYVTHIIIIEENDFYNINQIIGRAQRIGRKCNLQVLKIAYNLQDFIL